MISSLKGILTEVNPPNVVIDVGGVGYLLQASMSTIYQLPAIGESVFIHTHMVVREDAQLLFGFYEPQERLLFQEIIKINGVGPKVALAILSNVTVVDLMHWVDEQAVDRFKKIPGVGPKTAQRIILDLKDKLSKFSVDLKTQVVMSAPRNHFDEAFEALIALGYKNKEAKHAIEHLQNDDTLQEPQHVIKAALKRLAR